MRTLEQNNSQWAELSQRKEKLFKKWAELSPRKEKVLKKNIDFRNYKIKDKDEEDGCYQKENY